MRTLHRVGIIHRDIKPDNIKIRTQDDAAVLLDFGLTKKVEEAGGYGTAPLTGTARFGTAGYAPENPRERESPEKRSDIHALGMTLYRLLTGRDPQDLRQLREMREYDPRYFNPAIAPETERLIMVAIAPELPLRYQSIDDFIADLELIRRPNDNGQSLPPFTFADGSKGAHGDRSGAPPGRAPEGSGEVSLRRHVLDVAATKRLCRARAGRRNHHQKPRG